MANPKSSFVLKKSSSNKDLHYVWLYLNFGYKEFNPKKNKYTYKPLRYPTGTSVSLQEWDSENKRPLVTSKLNEVLTIEKIALDIYNYLNQGDSEITPDILKNELDIRLKRKSEEKKLDENQPIEIVKFIENDIVNGDNNHSSGTIRNYTKLANKIKAFQESTNITLTTANLDENTYKAFIQDVRKKVNRINSVWDMSKLFKAVLNEISRTNKDISIFNPTSDLAKADRISLTTEEKVYLNFDHIQKIIEHNPETEKLKNTKLIFLTLLFSGCRYSDVFKVIPEHTYNDGEMYFRYARFIDQKTDKDIIVPILAPLEDAYTVNNGNPPYKISDVKFNEYVKELVKDAELDHDVTLSFTNSFGKKEYETKPFFQHVSSHVGRRSFITNLINFVPVTILSKITGHSLTNKDVIFSYNKITPLENAKLFVRELKRLQETHFEYSPFDIVR